LDPFVQFVVRVSLMAIPLYLCNSLALLFGRGTPIDLGKNFLDGRRLLGDGKTVRGTFVGIVLGTAGAFLVKTAFPETALFLQSDYLAYGALLAVGAILGDFAGSFLKRRKGIERGKSVFLLDQLDFVVGGLAIGSLLVKPSLLEWIFLLAFTMLAHVLGNWIAYLAKLKKNPW